MFCPPSKYQSCCSHAYSDHVASPHVSACHRHWRLAERDLTGLSNIRLRFCQKKTPLRGSEVLPCLADCPEQQQSLWRVPHDPRLVRVCHSCRCPESL